MRPKPFPAYEIGGKPVGIVTTVIVGVAVGVHIAEVIAVVLIRGTLPPISNGTATARSNRHVLQKHTHMTKLYVPS